MAKYGKRATAARAAFEGKHNVTVEEAVKLVKDQRQGEVRRDRRSRA